VQKSLNIKRLLLDVDKALPRPSLLDIVAAITGCKGVEATNVTVSDIDIETVGMDVTIEGDGLDYDEIAAAIEDTGAVVHGIEQIVAGDRLLERVPRVRG
jgi:uncharacterized protein